VARSLRTEKKRTREWKKEKTKKTTKKTKKVDLETKN